MFRCLISLDITNHVLTTHIKFSLDLFISTDTILFMPPNVRYVNVSLSCHIICSLITSLQWHLNLVLQCISSLLCRGHSALLPIYTWETCLKSFSVWNSALKHFVSRCTATCYNSLIVKRAFIIFAFRHHLKG